MHSVAQMPWCDEVAQNPVVEQAAASAIGTLVIRTPGRKIGLHGGQTNIETASAPARPGSRSASCAAPPKSWEDLGPARASPAAPRRARRRPRSRQGRPGSEAVRPQQSSVSSFRQRATAGRDRRSRSSRRSDEASAGPPGFRIPPGRRKVSIKSGNSNPPAAAQMSLRRWTTRIATVITAASNAVPSGCHQAGGDQEAAAQLDAAGQQRNRLGTRRVSLVPTDTLCWHSRPRVPKTITRKTIYKRLVDDVSGGFS